MIESTPELIQFERSHFNEKARWALDYKAIAHTRTCLLPGLHAPAVKKMTGATEVPILKLDGELVVGSDRIIDELEKRQPTPSLYPEDAAERARALEIQSMFDQEVGPAVRAALFAVFLEAPGYFCTVFSTHASAPKRFLYWASYPLARPMIVSSMKLDDRDYIARANARTEEALEFVAENAGPEGYLVGDRFTVADLAAAALLAPATALARVEMKLPEPKPAPVVAWHDRWAGHPGTAWVRARYENDRSPSSVC